MRKIYSVILFALAITIFNPGTLRAQCGVVPAPVITGSDFVCGSAGTFTFTATGPSSLTAWYTTSPASNVVSSNSVFVTPNLTTTTNYYAAQLASTTFSLFMPPQVTTNTGNTRGFFFIAPNAFTITGLRVPTDASSANSNLAVINLTGGSPPAFPAFTNAFTLLYLGQNIPGTAIVPVNIPIAAGTTVGVLGDRGGICSYATGSSIVSFLGNNITLERMGMQFPLSSTSPQDIWTEASFISRVEIYGNGYCSSTLTPVTASVAPPPAVTVSPSSTLVCAGAPATTLTASGASSYTWSTQTSTTEISVSPASTTSYTLFGSNQPNCIGSAVYELTVSPVPVINISPSPSVLCTGKSATLSLSGAGSFTWSSGFSTNPMIVSPVVTSTYAASGTSTNGCVGSSVITLTVSPLPTASIAVSPSVVCAGQSATLTAASADTYSWSTGQTAQSIVVTPAAVSVYTLKVTNAVGCSSSSPPLTLITAACTGLDEIGFSGTDVQFFPNPTNGRITLHSALPVQSVSVKDLSGRSVIEQSLNGQTGLQLDLGQLSPGIYLAEVKQQSGTWIFRIVKN